MCQARGCSDTHRPARAGAGDPSGGAHHSQLPRAGARGQASWEMLLPTRQQGGRAGPPSTPKEPVQPTALWGGPRIHLGTVASERDLDPNHRVGAIHLWGNWGHHLERGQTGVSPRPNPAPGSPQSDAGSCKAGPRLRPQGRKAHHTANRKQAERPTCHCSHYFSTPPPHQL